MSQRKPAFAKGLKLAAAIAIFGSLGFLALEACIYLVPLPDTSRAKNLSTTVAAEDGRILKVFLSNDAHWRFAATPADAPRHYLEMLLAYEDKRFYSHQGVDELAVIRAAGQFIRYREAISGASTLSMQVVRLLEKPEPGIVGKIRQALQAVKLERSRDKRTILSLYLTLAPFGGNLEGIKAASLYYFGVEPKQLSLGQSALLVALPQSPEKRRPRLGRSDSRDARDRVLRRMADRGVISNDALAEALSEPVLTGQPHVQMAHHLAERLRTGVPAGGSIRTLISKPLQAHVEALAASQFDHLPDAANIAILVVRRRDMAARAYVGGGNYFAADRAGMLDLVRAVRSPGSALKPLVYGMAFEELIVHPQTIVQDEPIRIRGYAPENFDRKYRGEITIRNALVQSLNTIVVRLLNDISPEKFIDRMRMNGVSVEMPDSRQSPGLAVGLGGLGISLENIATLYAAIGNTGSTRPIRFTMDAPLPATKRMIAPDAAWAVTDVLADVPPPAGRIGPRSRDGGRRIAHKTGTSYGFKDAWSIGYDLDHVVAVWVGRPDAIGRPGQTGAATAVPVMFKVFDLLPIPERDVAFDRPRDSVLAAAFDIPDRLQRYESMQPQSANRIEIRFPLNDTTVNLVRDGENFQPLTFTVNGGKLPMRWIVDGKALDAAGHSSRTIRWEPLGRGQIDVVVIDANGSKAESTAWLN
jgi:penicillin-binding protein 1C